MTKDKRGGKREGAGAKPQYKEPTKTIAFRVPVSRAEEIKKVVRAMLEKYKLIF